MTKEKLVMAFGTFDLLHPGHLDYLKRARGLGDRLIVVIGRDRSVELLKGKKPVLDEESRREIVGSLKVVEKAMLGNRISGPEDRYKIIREYRPDIIVFGYDQKVNVADVKRFLKKNGMQTRVVVIKTGRNAKVFKSSALARRMAQ